MAAVASTRLEMCQTPQQTAEINPSEINPSMTNTRFTNLNRVNTEVLKPIYYSSEEYTEHGSKLWPVHGQRMNQQRGERGEGRVDLIEIAENARLMMHNRGTLVVVVGGGGRARSPCGCLMQCAGKWMSSPFIMWDEQQDEKMRGLTIFRNGQCIVMLECFS